MAAATAAAAAAAVSLLGLPALALAASAPTFQSASYAACARASWAEPVDVTGDGALDLVVSGEGDDSVVVLKGDGRGGFALFSSVASGGDGPYSLDVAELSGDGRLDVAVINRWSKTVTVLAGDGAGRFTFLTSVPAGAEGIDVKAMDLNEDGALDLVSCNMWTTSLNVLFNDGAGRFTRVDVPLPFKGATVMGYGDLDADGHVDIAVGHYWGTSATVLMGDGEGGLTVGASLPVGRYPTGAVFDDFNADGHQDVIVASRYPNNANVFLGDGTGAFSGPTRYTVGPFAKVLAPADYNLDGHLDVAVCNWGADGVVEKTVSMLTGHGDGTFDPEVRLQVGDKPHSVATADLDGDGRPDLVTPNTNTGDVTVLLNTTPFTAVDVTPPVTTSTADAAWHRTDVTVTLSATDAMSGVTATYHRLDGAAWQAGTSVPVSGDGVHALEFYSVDGAGNTEGVRSAVVKIDGTAPTGTVAAPAEGAAYPQGSGVVCDWAVTDPGGAAASGVVSQAAIVDGQPMAKGARLDTLAAGAHTFLLTVTDAAGNVSSAQVHFTVTAEPVVDTTPPQTNAAFSGAAGAAGWWVAPSVSIALEADDGGGSGVQSTWYALRAQGEPEPVWPDDYAQGAALTIPTQGGAADGLYTLYYRSRDLADPPNLEQVRTAPVRIDATAPVTTSDASAGWRRTAATVTLSPADATSGVAATRYRVDGAAWQTATSVPVSGDGVHTVEFYSVDVAGNAETAKSAQVKIDGTAPAVALSAPTQGAVYLQGAAATCGWAATDPGGAAASGVVTESATVDGRPVAKGSRLDTLAAGGHDFSLTATDAAGNSTTVTAHFTVATVQPVFAVLAPNGGETFQAGAATSVTWTYGTPVATGIFAVWAISDAGRWYGLGNVTPNGSAAYSMSWVVKVPAGRYRIRVSHGPQAGTWTATDYSDGYVTVGSGLAVTSPNGGETLPRGSSKTVTWALGAPASSGVFAVWAVSDAGRWYGVANATADGRAAYSAPWVVNVPAGRYRIRVSYGPQVGTWTLSDYSDAYFTVTAP